MGRIQQQPIPQAESLAGERCGSGLYLTNIEILYIASFSSETTPF